MPVPVLVGIGGAVTWIASAFATMAGTVITFLTSKFFLRSAAIAVAMTVYAAMFIATYDVIKLEVQSAVTAAQSWGVAGDGITIATCMMPSSIPQAITVLINIVVLGVTLKIGRQVLIAKAGG